MDATQRRFGNTRRAQAIQPLGMGAGGAERADLEGLGPEGCE